MKYAVEMGSVTMVYITTFHKGWFRHSKFDEGHSQTDRMEIA
jgi:hypothetical protein